MTLPSLLSAKEESDVVDEVIDNAVVGELIDEATGDAFTVTDKGLLVEEGKSAISGRRKAQFRRATPACHWNTGK